MKPFVLGFFMAAALLIALYFFGKPGLLITHIGCIMDEDAVYLKSGRVIYGRIIDEEPGSIIIEEKNGTYTLPRDNCVSIKKNLIGRYFRELP
jgi:hypothetical protein